MPELPELLHILSTLREELLGRQVTAERVPQPVVVRFAVRGNLSLLLGRALLGISRRSHYLFFGFEGLDLAVNPMLAGRFRLVEPGAADEAALCFSLEFSARPEGRAVELRYLDQKKMGKAYLIGAGDWKAIPGMQTGGVDILSSEFTTERFVSLLRHRRDQVRAFLMDKKAIDSLGNAYADEVLFEAGIHPKTWCRSLTRDEAVRLHRAIVEVMRAAVEEVACRAQPIDVKVRDFLKIRRKPVCPRCGSKVRKTGVRGMDAYFCPRCQPATRASLVDWRRTGR
jgi:formamidopyrimidine-DNA glycosylase